MKPRNIFILILAAICLSQIVTLVNVQGNNDAVIGGDEHEKVSLDSELSEPLENSENDNYANLSDESDNAVDLLKLEREKQVLELEKQKMELNQLENQEKKLKVEENNLNNNLKEDKKSVKGLGLCNQQQKSPPPP